MVEGLLLGLALAAGLLTPFPAVAPRAGGAPPLSVLLRQQDSTPPDHSLGRLEIVVADPSGALVLSGVVEIRPAAATEWEGLTASTDRWTAKALAPGTYAVRVSAPGFQTQVIEPLVIGGGTTRRTVRLALDSIQALVIVESDPRTAALDPRGFSTFLSPEQIAALPDDPVALEQALRELAPPGAVMRIDGFTGGLMPPKSQILSIRIPRLDSLAAQEHGGLNAFSVIDIVTRPGAGTVQGSAGVTVQTATLNARNPLAATRAPASTVLGDIAIDGPLRRDRTSFAVSLRATRQTDTETIRAATPEDAGYSREVERPAVGMAAAARMTSTLAFDQTLRASFSTDAHTTRNVGIGGYSLEERGYATSSMDRILRLSIGGPLGRRRNLDSRVQLRWTGTRNESLVEAPTVQVLDAFTAGGAQATSGERGFAFQAASDLDYARGGHAWRTGVLVDTARRAANRRSNYLGTYIFPSLADFESGNPAFFTRRVGDARISYTDHQSAAYAQDDYRVSRSVLLSYGVRLEKQNLLPGAPAVLPRAGVIWAPRRHGATSVRAGWGLVQDWFPDAVYEQTRLVDGQRQYDLRIADPSFPVSAETGTRGQRETLRLADGLTLSHGQALSVGLEHQVSSSVRLFVSSGLRHGNGLLRGHNLNPLVDGHRSDATAGNVIETRGDAGLHSRTLSVQSLYASSSRRVDASASYVLNRSTSNTAGAFWIPASGDDLTHEWGPIAASQAFMATITGRRRGLSATLSSYWRTGTPYTVILATATQDGYFVARPPGVDRNASRTPPQAAIGARLSYGIALGSRTVSPPAGSQGSNGTPAVSARSDSRRFRMEFQASAQNLTNRPNYVAVGNVVGSPLFGRPVSAAPPRTIDLGVRVTF
jgi:hypothetical protein